MGRPDYTRGLTTSDLSDQVGNPADDGQTIYDILAKAAITALTTDGDSFVDRVNANLAQNPGGTIPAQITALNDVLRMNGQLAASFGDHFDAVSLADLPIPWTEDDVGTGSKILFLDDEPSAINLQTSGNLGDQEALLSDRTISLSSAPDSHTKIVVEARVKVPQPSTTTYAFGLFNDTTDEDSAEMIWDSKDTALDSGGLRATKDDATSKAEQGWDSVITVTEYNTYRLEFTPGTQIEAFLNGASQGTLATNVPVDQAFRLRFLTKSGANGANRKGIWDYIRVWTE